MLFALMLALAAEVPVPDKVVYFDVDGTTVEVRITKSPEYLTDNQGNAMVFWDEADADRIINAMTNANLSYAIPSVLGNMRRPDQETTCVHWDYEGTDLSFTVPGKIYTDGHGRIAWNERQLAVIQEAMEVYPEGLSQVYRLRLHTTEVVESAAQEPLKPKCNECLQGATCTVNGTNTCCTSTSYSCMACKTCIKVGGAAPEAAE